MSRFGDRVRDPVVWSDLLQLAKTAGAAVLAWVLAVEVFSLPQSFLAPWAALLTIHATVYRTLARGLQQAAAAVVGVLLAFAAGITIGVTWESLAVVLLVALAVGALRPMRAESTTAAATALVVLLTGYSDDGSMLLARLADTFVGIGVGLVVTLAGWPPLRDPQRRASRRRARRQPRRAAGGDGGEAPGGRRAGPGPGPLGPADARPRPWDRRGVGRRPVGARERAAQPPASGRAARAGQP